MFEIVNPYYCVVYVANLLFFVIFIVLYNLPPLRKKAGFCAIEAVFWVK